MRIFKIMETAFDNYDQSIKTYLSKAFGDLGLNYTNSQIFGVIFTGLKGVVQNLLFYIEDALTEQNIYTAVRKKSIYSLARISGYEPYYGTAASGTLLCKVIINNGLENKSSKIYIKNYSTVQNTQTGINYIINLPTDYYVIDISKPLITHEFKITQGYWSKATFTASGYYLESLHVDGYGFYDKDSLVVLVDGVEFKQAANLYDMTYKSKEYLVNVGYDNSFDITFGNDIHGYSLREGQTVVVNYLVHNGEEGNISLYDTSSWKFITQGTDSRGESVNINNYATLEMNNTISNGMNADSISFVKEMIGSNSRSLVLVNENNFKLFLHRFSFVGYSNIWAAENSLTICASCLYNYMKDIKDPLDYYNLNCKDMLLSNRHKDMIITTLDNSKKTFAGLTLKFIDPIIRRYSIICYIKLNNKYEKEQVKDSISKELATYFLNLDINTNFIAKSDIINLLVNSNENIKSLDIMFNPEINEIAYKDGYYINYEWKFQNGEYQYIPKKIFYEKNNVLGLDMYGNIQTTCNMEMIFLNGGFKYYTSKNETNKNIMDSIDIPTIQYFFL